MKSILIQSGIVCALLAAVVVLTGPTQAASAPAQKADRVFELRTYTANPGKFEAMKARFQNSILALFRKHNMELIGFWTPADAPDSANKIVYVLAHPSREAADKNWAAFKGDPEKMKVWADTEKDGPINQKVESVFMNPLSFSPIK